MLNKRLMVALLAVAVLFLGIFSFAQTGNDDTTAPVITLLGEAEVTIEVGETYKDKGATALDDVDGNITDDINVDNPVDTGKVGKYTITYNVSDAASNAATEVTRVVNVVDSSAPVITLQGQPVITVRLGNTYTDAGATATDDVDGDLTDSIVTVNNVNTERVGRYTVTYNVSDSNNNVATQVVRTVNVVDTTDPIVILNGNSEITLDLGEIYNEEGAIATDNADDALTVDITGTVNTNIVGVYTLTYSATDNSNNTVSIIRVVTVRPVIEVQKTGYTLDSEDTTGNTLIVEKGEAFTMPTAIAKLGFANSNVVAEGNVLADKVGTYTLRYRFVFPMPVGTIAAEQRVLTVKVVDTTAPIAEVSYDVTEWTKGNVVATIVPSEDVTVANNEGKINYTFTANGSFTFEFVDASGNIGSVTATVNNIDKEAPTVLFGTNGNDSFAQTAKTTITVEDASAVDNDSLKYQWTQNTTAPEEASFMKTFVNGEEISSPNKISGIYYLWVLAKDITGNKNIISSNQFSLDNIKPVINGVKKDNNYKNPVTPIVTDDNLDSLKLLIEATGETIDFISGAEISGEGRYVLTAIDKAGNKEYANFYLDYTLPTIKNGTEKIDSGSNFNTDVNLVVFDRKLTTVKINNQTFTSSKNKKHFTVSYNKYSSNVTFSYPLIEEGTYTITAIDLAGNEETTTFTIDTTAPTAEVSYDVTEWTNGNVVATIAPSEVVAVTNNEEKQNYTFTTNGSFKFELVDTSGNTGSVTATVNNIDKVKPIFKGLEMGYHSTGNIKIDVEEANLASIKVNNQDTRKTITVDNGYELTDEATYYLTAKDLAGNEESIYVAIDKTAPTIFGITDGSYINKAVELTIFDKFLMKVQINEKTYDRKSKEFTASNNQEDWTFTKTLTAEGTYTVTAIDKVGHVTSLTFTIDKTSVVVTVDKKNGESSNNHDVRVSATDPSGIAHLRYGWFTEENGITRSQIKTPLVNNVENPNIAVAPDNLNGTYYLWIYVKDKAQNRSHMRVGPFVFDNEAPVITSVTGNPKIWGTADVILTVTATDNVGVTEYSFDGGTTWSSENTITLVGTDNKYIRARDAAGNVSSEHHERVIYIDKQGPTIQLDVAKEAKFYSQSHSRKITVSDNESGVNENTLRYLWTEDRNVEITSEIGEAFTNNATISTPVGVSGKYYLIVIASDKVGNQSIFKSKEFYLDNTFPVLNKIVASDIYFEVGTPLPPINELVEATDNYDGNIIDRVYILKQPDMNTIGDYLVEFYVKDSSGNKSYTPLRVHVQDTKAPDFTVSSNPTILTKENVVLTINANDSGVGLATEAYSFDGGTTWSSVNTKIFTENGIVSIKVRDAIGNVSNVYSYTISNIVLTSSTFDDGTLALSNSEAAGKWYTDRYAPADFKVSNFDGANRLQQVISVLGAANVRSGSYSSAFYNTQGRKYNVSNATEVSVDLYVPGDWATTGRRMAGFWGTGYDSDSLVTLYPIIEFTSDNNNPRFRVWPDNESEDGYHNLGLPTGFEYDKWYTLSIKINPLNNTIIYKIGNITYTKTGINNATRIGNVILQGHNTTDGVDYNIYWDNFIAKR